MTNCVMIQVFGSSDRTFHVKVLDSLLMLGAAGTSQQRFETRPTSFVSPCVVSAELEVAVQVEAVMPADLISGSVKCCGAQAGSSFCVFGLFEAAGRRRVPTRLCGSDRTVESDMKDRERGDVQTDGDDPASFISNTAERISSKTLIRKNDEHELMKNLLMNQ